MDAPVLSFKYSRRFGVEMEINSFDNRDFKLKPLDRTNGELPKGIEEVGFLIASKIHTPVNVKGWHKTHNNENWVLKPDRSCGMEVCSPVSKGWSGLKSICEVADIMSKDKRVKADNRCSLHVHVDCQGCDSIDIARILNMWVKCESVFLDSVPSHRKRNSYCWMIGMTDMFEHDMTLDTSDIIRKLGETKYFTANCYHMFHKSRVTVEYRIAEAEACLNPFLVKNWVRLLVHFTERALAFKTPTSYVKGNPWSGMCWLDVEDVFKLLGFNGEYNLSKGMEQTRNWFLARLWDNVAREDKSDLPGAWSAEARSIARMQIDGLAKKLDLSTADLKGFLRTENQELVYSQDYKA